LWSEKCPKKSSRITLLLEWNLMSCVFCGCLKENKLYLEENKNLMIKNKNSCYGSDEVNSRFPLFIFIFVETYLNLTLTHTRSLSHTHSLTHTLSHTLSLSHCLPFSFSHTLSLIISLSLSLFCVAKQKLMSVPKGEVCEQKYN